eukprot:TRINITY_DN17330_c0_g1_i1.p1 TRINITY_DN17330_c0_g1~~TRINITY_DN17330_c0_g1_i1.p1  ORF type:complete len:564 (-),score=96.23 TRINITY_DN17330_c0_g1_i1:40-1731(-)
MVRLLPILAVLGLFLVLASCDRSFLQSSEASALPSGWIRDNSEVNGEQRIKLIFALKQRNLEVLDETFWAVSTPGNPRYGKHLTIEQINDIIAPSKEDTYKVLFWLKSQGVRDAKVERSKDYLTCSVTIKQAEKIFDVKFNNYKHTSGRTFTGTLGPYSVPSILAQHIDLVSGLVGLPNLDFKHSPIKNPLAGPGGKDITPVIIRTRYNVSDDLVVTNANNSHAVAEFQGEYYSPSDLATFFADYVPFAPAQTVAKVIGTNVEKDPGLEASLDVQYIMGVAPNATTWFYSYASDNFWNDLLNWTTTLASSSPIPWILSVSYGAQGDYPPNSTIQRLDTEFQKIGARGVSIIIASGDHGSGCALGAADLCSCVLYPSYPASSPYVTAIGATKFLSGNAGPEGAVTAFGSGGGFFADDTQQSYQTAAVAHYFATTPASTLPPACSYNQANRATPDGSALGDVHFQVVMDGSVTSVGGTSASTPTWAAIFTLLNDIRFNNNEASLGFLNVWLYQTAAANPTAFFDVTVGNNVVADCCTNGGFQCAPGWDPATGVGTPNFAVLSTLV